MVMSLIFPYAATTRGITVRVAPRYLPDQSDPDAPRHVWSYHVRIENGGTEAVQLRSRRWLIRFRILTFSSLALKGFVI